MANVALYQTALADLEPAELEAACLKALSECRFMPTVADIRSHIKRVAVVEQASARDDEWADILSKIQFWDEYYHAKEGRGWGSDGPPKLSAAGSQAVRACGGFSAIQATKPEYLPILKKQFDEAYHRQIEHAGNMQLEPGSSEKRILEAVTPGIGGLIKGMP